MIDEIVEKLSQMDHVRLVMLGGSRASGSADRQSDVDLYVYYDQPIPLVVRKEMLGSYFKYVEFANGFWEEEDDGILLDGVEMEIIYRPHTFIKEQYEKTFVHHEVSLGYSTCMIYNLLRSKILVDHHSDIQWFRNIAQIYPDELRKKIMLHNASLIYNQMPSLSFQLIKALKRQDAVSVQHRTTEFIALIFDVLFAANRMFHPGEKRLSEALERMSLIPEHFKEDLKQLLVIQSLSIEDAVLLVQVMGERLNVFVRLLIPEYTLSGYINNKF
jgi:predicted nucleotidyltransferase